MSIKQPYSTSLRHVGAYQVSGRPWCQGNINAAAGTTYEVTFPYVTRWIKIINNGNSDVKVGFSASGVGGTNYFTVKGTSGNEQNQTELLELKTTSLFLTGSNSVDIVAGLTNIPREQMYTLSGDGID